MTTSRFQPSSTPARGLSRRRFVQAAVGGAAALPAVLPAGLCASEEKRLPPKAGRPKIGCTSWAFHSFRGGSDPTESIERMAELGFEGTDLILLAREDIDGFWTDQKIGDLRRRLERGGVAVAQFVIFQPVVQGLSSTDRSVRERNLDYFEAGCRIGKKFGAPLVNIVAPWAREIGRNRGYLPRFYDLERPKPGEKFHIDIDPAFDWDAVWENWVEVTKACLERVKAHGMKLTIEHHTHTIVPDAVSFLRLWDRIRDPALGYNLDTGWTLSQREYPPVAIHKTKRQLMNLHVRDIDGLMRRFVHVGTGVMDFRHIVQTLKAVGFTGYMSLEQDKFPGDMAETCKRYIALMKEHLSE